MKIKFNPFLKEVRGKIGDTVFRLCHTGEWQIAARPDMSKVKWSAAQKAHRERFGNASRYAKVCMKIPELRAFYLEMAHKRGTKRPFDEAVRDYFQGNNLIFERPEPMPVKKEQNLPQRTGLASSSPTTAPSTVTPATKNDRWIFDSPVPSIIMNEGGSVGWYIEYVSF